MKLLNKITILSLTICLAKQPTREVDSPNLENENPGISKLLENQGPGPAVCDKLSYKVLADTPGWVYMRKILDDKESIEKVKTLIKFSYKNKTELEKLFREILKEVSLNDLIEMGYKADPFEFFKSLNEKYSKSSSVFSEFSELLVSLQKSFTAYAENNLIAITGSFEDELNFRRHVLRFLLTFTYKNCYGESESSKFQILNQQVRPLLTDSQYDLLVAKFIALINENRVYSQSHVDFTIGLDEFITLRCENIAFLAQKIGFALDNNDDDLYNITFDTFIDELKLMFFNKQTYREFKGDKQKFMYRYQLIDVSPDQPLDVNN